MNPVFALAIQGIQQAGAMVAVAASSAADPETASPVEDSVSLTFAATQMGASCAVVSTDQAMGKALLDMTA